MHDALGYRAEWDRPDSENCLTSKAFYKMLHKLIMDRNSDIKKANTHDRLEVDVLLTGCEASLWIGEHFAGDLQDLFPSLRVVAMSANKIIGICLS